MPDIARVAHSIATEIPVTVQGSHTAEGAGRELFTENAKTILVFDTGAVLNLQSRVDLGQSLFLRNEQSGREAVCRVMEAPKEGKTGPTEVEFIAPLPGFWGVQTEGGEAAQTQPAPTKAASTEQRSASDQNPLAMMGQNAANRTASEFTIRKPYQEELVPMHEAPPTTVLLAPPPVEESTGPTGEQIDAALKKIASLQPDSRTRGTAPASSPPRAREPDDAKDALNLAALMATDAKRAQRSAAEKKKGTQRVETATAAGVPEVAADGEPGSESEVAVAAPTLQQRLANAVDRLTTGEGLIVSEIAASIVILVALGFIWHAVAPLFSAGNERPAATAVQSRSPAPASVPSAAGVSAKTGNSGGVATPVKASALTAKPAQPRVPRPTIAAPAAKLLAGPSVTGAAPNHSALGAGVSPGGSTMDTGANALTPEQARARATAKVQQLHTRNFSGTAPARILWQVQPGVPSWANKLEIEQSVVKLDAVIDENGNLAQTRVLSGPRALQHSAQQAVGLWIFAPAQADGRPAPSHMILTVEFQR